MTDGVGEEESDVVFVEPHNVIEIPAHVAGGAVQRVEMHGSKLRNILRQKILLQPGGQPELFVNAVEIKLQRLITPAQKIHFLGQRIDLGLNLKNGRVNGRNLRIFAIN